MIHCLQKIYTWTKDNVIMNVYDSLLKSIYFSGVNWSSNKKKTTNLMAFIDLEQYLKNDLKFTYPVLSEFLGWIVIIIDIIYS